MLKLLLIAASAVLFTASVSAQDIATEQTMENKTMNAQDLIGKTVAWEWVDGPFAGNSFQNTFHEDGTITWRGIEGFQKGNSETEKEYKAFDVAEDVVMISWLEDSGWTVTVTVNFSTMTNSGVISNETKWFANAKGVVQIVD